MLSKFKYVEDGDKKGYKETDCGCGGRKPSAEIHQVDMNKILLYVGPVRTRINGFPVIPNALIIGLNDQYYQALSANPRFKIPTEEQKRTLEAVFAR